MPGTSTANHLTEQLHTLEHPAQIVVIYDNDSDVEILRGALSKQGEPFELTILQDGEAALRFIADHRSGLRPPQPCVIVLDVNLAKHDGLAVLAALKAERGVSHIKVLVVGILTSPETRALLRAMGGLCREKPSNGQGWLALAAELIALCNKRQRPKGGAPEELSQASKKALRTQGADPSAARSS